MDTIKIGIDIGYSAVKVRGNGVRATFPSVVGTPDRSRFSLSADDSVVIEKNGQFFLVGQAAIEQSRFTHRREDRAWITSEEYSILMLAAFSEVVSEPVNEVVIVTGLPAAFYESDKEELRSKFIGTHTVARDGRRSQQVNVRECRVIPQHFGTVLHAALNDKGEIASVPISTGRVGVIDIGGKTTGLLSVYRMSEVSRETASVNVGGWDVVRQMRNWLTTNCPNLDLRDHEIANAIANRRISYYGKVVDLTEPVGEVGANLAEQIIATATQLWSSAAKLDTILITGGGATLLGESITSKMQQAVVIDDPVEANVNGYWKFAIRVSQGQK